jgi:hypothetical protein
MMSPLPLSAEEKASESNDDVSAETDSEETAKDSSFQISDRRRPHKKFLSELTIFGGDYLGDEWHNTWDVGAMYTLHFNETFGASAAYTYSQLDYDASGNFGRSVTDDNVHMGNGALVINNDCAFRAGKSIIECDLFMTVGGGGIKVNRVWEWMIVIGGGMRIYTPLKWFAVRFDVNSYLHPTPNPTGNTFDSDIAMNLGLSFIIPAKKQEEEMRIREAEERAKWKTD